MTWAQELVLKHLACFSLTEDDWMLVYPVALSVLEQLVLLIYIFCIGSKGRKGVSLNVYNLHLNVCLTSNNNCHYFKLKMRHNSSLWGMTIESNKFISGTGLKSVLFVIKQWQWQRQHRTVSCNFWKCPKILLILWSILKKFTVPCCENGGSLYPVCW